MSTASQALARAAALIAASLGLALGGTYLPAPLKVSAPAEASAAKPPVTQPLTQTQSVCPGPETLGVRGLPQSMLPPALSAHPKVSVAAASAPTQALPNGVGSVPGAGAGVGSVVITGLPRGGSESGPPTAVTTRGAVISAPVSTARSAVVSGAGALAPGTVATQWSWIRTGNSRALVTTACMPAAASSWLLAGGGEPGRLEHLVLANPGPNPVVVDVSVYGSKGLVDSPGGRGLVIAGQARTVILVDAISGSEVAPVVHVGARGGRVAAVLSDRWLDGLVPRGGDDVGPAAGQAREQVITGISHDGQALLRLVVPGDREAVVESRALTPGGPRPLPAGGVTRVSPRSTRDIDLSALPPGPYAVQVKADVPVVASVMVDRRRGAAEPSDLAWSAASSPISTLAGLVLPAKEVVGLAQRLDLAATEGPASVRVTTVNTGGSGDTVKSKEVAVAADSVSSMTLGSSTSVWVTPVAGRVRAAVLSWGTGAGAVPVSVTPLANLTLTRTPLPIRQMRD